MLSQVIHPQRIVNRSISDRRVVERRAVFRNVDGQLAVAVTDPDQRVDETLREYFPTGLGVDGARVLHPVSALDHLLLIVFGDSAGVVVEADEVDRLLDVGEIARWKLRPRFAE